jgi:two-component system LytT family response regulator
MEMPFIKAVLIDDEADGRNIIRYLLKAFFPAIRVAGEAEGVADGIRVITSVMPDLVFLDVEMQDGNAFNLLPSCEGWSGDVILVTAYDSYALKAIKASVLDYILKPVDEQDFISAVNKALAKRENKTGTKPASVLLDIYKHLSIRKTQVPTLNGFSLINIDTIIRCEASGNYTNIFLGDRQPIIACRKLGEYEKELESYGFIRIHKKHLVNVTKIIEYNKGKSGGGYITLTGREVLEVSARKKNDLLSLLRG